VSTARDSRCILFVHAHPDDESIGTGATMAKYAAEGAHVVLVTCTLGELGEVIPEDLKHLAADRDNRLGEHRIGELAAACAALGVTDHRFLGGPGRWHDSGMMGTPANEAPGAFWQADLDEAAGELLRVIREVRPQVLVTYDANGFYGHPDHIQAHRVAWRAFELAGGTAASSPRGGIVRNFYATAVPKSVLAQAIESMRDRPGQAGGGIDFSQVSSVDELPFGVPDEEVTTEIDAGDFLDAKIAALRAHASQIVVNSSFFALADNVGLRAIGARALHPAGRAAGAGIRRARLGERSVRRD
jgi:N-acetyl-1-D-myo-inositol-2-amino-2-deoxy-alpha-D-glucopyranoside deacetylase